MSNLLKYTTFLMMTSALVLMSGCNDNGGGGNSGEKDASGPVTGQWHLESWGMLKPSPEGARQAARLIDAFVRYHLGLEWSNGRFRSL